MKRVTIVVALLVIGLLPAFSQDTVSTVSLSVNQNFVTTGDQVTVTISTSGGGISDLFLALVLPDGSFMCIKSDGSLGTINFAETYYSNWDVTTTSFTAFSITIPTVDSNLAGNYQFYSIFTSSGADPTNLNNWISSSNQSVIVSAVENSHDVIIVGGGISGLTSAYYLKNYNTVLLEKETRIGGRTVAGTHNNFTYAMGTEYLGPPDGPLEAMIRDLSLTQKEIPSPTDAAWRNNTYYWGEDGIFKMYIENSDLETFNRFGQTILQYISQYKDVPDLDMTSEIASLDNLTARQWLNQLGFTGIYQERYNVASKGLFGATIDEISALSFIPEIAFDFYGFQGVSNVEDLDNEVPTPGTESTSTYSFETGITELTNAIGNSLGTSLKTGSTVLNVRMLNGKYIVTYKDSSNNYHSLESKVVVMATPAPVTLNIASSVLTDQKKTIMQQIPYVSFITIALFSNTAIFDKAFDLAVPEDFFFTDVYDSTWVQRYYNSPSGSENTYICGIYIAPSSYTDTSIMQLSDDQLLENTYADLEKIFPNVRSQVTGYDVHRHTYAYPVMTTGAYGRLNTLNGLNEGSLLLAGDYMIYPTFEAAAQSGYDAAQAAIEELTDN